MGLLAPRRRPAFKGSGAVRALPDCRE
jgi:hypothetical protein